LRVITLGTGAGRPTPIRSASATALEYEGDVILFDCGEGTQVQLARSTLRWGAVSAIFIGHLHGDHISGLPGLLGTWSLSDRTTSLKIFGPPGIRSYLDFLQRLKTLWIQYPVEVVEITGPGVILDEKEYQVETSRLDHIIECWGYVFREKPRPGYFDEEKAKDLGIPPGPERARLVRGESVKSQSGTMVRPEEVVGPPRRGRSVAYCLDTTPCKNDVALARGVDLLIHEATFDDSLREEMKSWGHSTAAQAAEVAKEAQARQLVLTHLSPRYPDPSPLLIEAQKIFPATEMAHDLSEFKVEASSDF
jgi:ribonuclease Z